MKFKYMTVNLGCRLNQAELTQLESVFDQSDCLYDKHQPQVIIVNTCAVTSKAEKESRQTLRRLKKLYPKAILVAWGCAAQRWQKDKTIKWHDWGVDYLYGNDNKDQHPFQFLKIKPQQIAESLTYKFANSQKLISRLRRFIKIQDGCRKYCTYCLIPYLRPRFSSKPSQQIIDEIVRAEKDGIKEVVLTGVDISSYGQDSSLLKDNWYKTSIHSLETLVQDILKKTTIPRIRFGSINPTSFTPSFINLFEKQPRLMPHLHICLQSGSNHILKLMNRNYTKEQFWQTIQDLRATVPDILISTDVIVGFPGETGVDFQETVEFIKKIKFSRLHVFPYSPRPQIAATKLKLKPVPSEVIKHRAYQLRQLSQQLNRYWRRQFKGRSVRVLWESYKKGKLYGLSHNYLDFEKRGSLKQLGSIESLIVS